MAKIIKLTPEYIDEVRRDFENALKGIKLSDGKIYFSKTFGGINRKATVYFTYEAWAKMQALIREFDKEVAWHGVAYRGDDPDKDEYIVSDIMVYPQEVTGATVTTDQVKYQMWLYSEENDEVFDDIRMQGHSHVNMGTTPSAVDTSLYERILDQMDDSAFYIFLIYNKRGEKTYKIYDMDKNVLFETSDVTVTILEPDLDGIEINIPGLSEDENQMLTEALVDYRMQNELDAFIKDAKAKVVTKAPTYNYGNYVNGYRQDYGNCPSVVTPASAVAQKTPAPASVPASKPAASAPAADAKKNSSKLSGSIRKSGHKKGKRKNSDRSGKSIGGYSSLTPKNACRIYDDDIYDGFDDDPYGAFGYRDGLW